MYLFISLLILWLIIKFKTSRSDGVLVGTLHPYRYLIPFVMRSRNESVVYFDCPVRASQLLKTLENNDKTITHYLTYASFLALKSYPEMNRHRFTPRLFRETRSLYL